MIIFGTRGVNSTMDEGHFFCPQCEREEPYRHRKVTRFFTLYFIPIIPLGRIGDFVECRTCQGTYVPNVLEYRPDGSGSEDQFLAEYEKAMKHTMVLMMLADGEIDDQEMITVRDIVNKFGHHDITLEELEVYTNAVRNSPDDISTYLKNIGPSLNDHGKETIIKCALSVAAADGHIDDSEINLVYQMGDIMGMSKAHMKGILGEIEEEMPGASSSGDGDFV